MRERGLCAEDRLMNLEDVWSAGGTALVSTNLACSAKSKKTAGEARTVLRKAKVKHPAIRITVGYGFNESVEC